MFHTRFNVAESKNKNKVYDRHDNVDRLSYVDNTRLIERFIYEGQSLSAVRAKALRSGLYSEEDALNSNVNEPIIPVYTSDPAIMSSVIEESRKSLKSRVTVNDNDVNDDKIASNSDFTERSSDSTGPESK